MSCCSLSYANPEVFIYKAPQSDYEVIIDRTPKTFSECVQRFIQRKELLEKVAELVDEICHLTGAFFKKYPSLSNALYSCHDTAHSVENGLHSLCFVGDLLSIATGSFLVRKCNKSINWLQTAAKTCHALSHFIASARMAESLHFVSLGRVHQSIKIARVAYALSTLGFGLSCFADKRYTFANGTGCLFEAGHLAQTFLTKSHPSLNRITAIMGTLHAYTALQILLPKDREHFKVPPKNTQISAQN